MQNRFYGVRDEEMTNSKNGFDLRFVETVSQSHSSCVLIRCVRNRTRVKPSFLPQLSPYSSSRGRLGFSSMGSGRSITVLKEIWLSLRERPSGCNLSWMMSIKWWLLRA